MHFRKKYWVHDMKSSKDISVRYQTAVLKTHMKNIKNFHAHVSMPFSVPFYFIWQMFVEGSYQRYCNVILEITANELNISIDIAVRDETTASKAHMNKK